jgi:hypothetical protein
MFEESWDLAGGSDVVGVFPSTIARSRTDPRRDVGRWMMPVRAASLGRVDVGTWKAVDRGSDKPGADVLTARATDVRRARDNGR